MFNIEVYLQPKNILEVIGKPPDLAHHEEKFPWLSRLLSFPSGRKSCSKGVGIVVSERKVLPGRVLPGCHTVLSISEIKSRLQEGVLPRNGFNCEDRSPVSVVAMASRKFRAVFLFIVGTGGGHY